MQRYLEELEVEFAGEPGESFYFLMLGDEEPHERIDRVYQGGDQVAVAMLEPSNEPDCVDVLFRGGEYALDVPKDFFAVVG